MTETSESLHKISDTCCARLAEEVLRLVGHGKRYSVAEIATRAGCSVEAIYQLKQGISWPGAALFVRIAAALGKISARYVFGPSFCETESGEAPTHNEIQAMTASLVAMHADFMSDGKIDHTESARLRRLYREVRSLLRKYEDSFDNSEAAA